MTSPVRAGRGPLLARAGDPPSPPHRRLMGARSSVTARRDLGSSTPAATRSDEDNASPLSSSGQHGDGAPRAAAAQIRPAAADTHGQATKPAAEAEAPLLGALANHKQCESTAAAEAKRLVSLAAPLVASCML
uniref:Uncharacterized protein n=1 Tax=Oryza nivara TaxID=4536 RepID=A0A0E0IQV1_ORYNI